MKRSVSRFLTGGVLSSFILALTASFMFFVVEPITLYSGNIDDFWFDIYDMLPELLRLFGLVFIISFGGFLILSFLFGLSKKRKDLFLYVMAFLFVGFIITYIQGNFLAGSLPGLNGNPFNWREYPVQTAISILLDMGGAIGAILIIRKIKVREFVKYCSYVSAAIFMMLAVSLASVLLTTPNILDDKDASKASYDYFNVASTKQNFFIFLTDAIDSKSFSELLGDTEEYQETFKDFTFFSDAMSYYAYTRDSIPYIFSQMPNHNETGFSEYSRTAYQNSAILKSLKEDGFKMGLYEDEAIVNDETADLFENMSKTVTINQPNFDLQVIRYDLFRYLPYPLKGKAHIENLSFWSAAMADGKKPFTWWNIDNYEQFTNEKIKTTEDKVFHFVHVEGAHIPFDLDENLNKIDKNAGTYKMKQKATFKLIKAYIDRLKEAGVYNNSAIVVLADHGYMDGVEEYDHILNRFNPILYIKGVNEKHDETLKSEKPISYADLGEAFEDLRLGKKSEELFASIDDGAPRKRTLIYYVWNKENHMVEYEAYGKAWEIEKMTETGKVFDR